MRQVREAHNETLQQAAERFQTTSSTLSRIELAHTYPPPKLVHAYDETYDANGLLLNLLAWVAQERYDLSFETRPRALPVVPETGDRSNLIAEDPPDGKRFQPGTRFTKTWTLLNAGRVAWVARRLVRDTPPTAVGPTSTPSYPIPDTAPGTPATISIPMRAGLMPGSAIQYWSMRHADGTLCFPHRTAQ